MDIEKLLNEMTVEEKAALVSGTDFMYTNPIPRLDIPSLCMSDGPHGLRKQTDSGEQSELTYKMLPYAPGGYDLGDEYPFSKNVYTGPDTGYSFRWLYVDDDMRIRYLDEDYRPAINAEKGLGFVRKFGNETINISIVEEPWIEVLGDFI